MEIAAALVVGFIVGIAAALYLLWWAAPPKRVERPRRAMWREIYGKPK